MTGFGDWDADDSTDVDRADPQAVARILWGLLRARDPAAFRAWDDHTPVERAVRVEAVADLLARLDREGSV